MESPVNLSGVVISPSSSRIDYDTVKQPESQLNARSGTGGRTNRCTGAAEAI